MLHKVAAAGRRTLNACIVNLGEVPEQSGTFYAPQHVAQCNTYRVLPYTGCGSGCKEVLLGSGFREGTFKEVLLGSGFVEVLLGSGFMEVLLGSGFMEVLLGSGFMEVILGSGFMEVLLGNTSMLATLRR